MPRKLKFELEPIQLTEEPVGKRLARFRKQKGLTQSELAIKIGITQTLVSDYETGRTHLTDDMIIRFALVLEISADTILGLNQPDINTLTSASLRILKRLVKIETLSEAKQKALLQTIDGFLRGENIDI